MNTKVVELCYCLTEEDTDETKFFVAKRTLNLATEIEYELRIFQSLRVW